LFRYYYLYTNVVPYHKLTYLYMYGNIGTDRWLAMYIKCLAVYKAL